MHLRPNEGKWEATRLDTYKQKLLRVHAQFTYLLLCLRFCNKGYFEQSLQLRDEMHCMHCQLPMEVYRKHRTDTFIHDLCVS